MMKRYVSLAIVAVVMVATVVTADAIPRLQTYITGASYWNDLGGWDDTWLTRDNRFQMKVVGGWDSYSGSLWGSPVYSQMNTYLVIGVPRGETGSVWVNGVELTSFNNVKPTGLGFSNTAFNQSAFGELDLRYYRLGNVDNDQWRASDYMPSGWVAGPYLGDQLVLDIGVSGFSYAHFNATGIDKWGSSYMNPYSRDASFWGGFHGGGGGGHCSVPEPGTLSLLGFGLLGIIPAVRRKRRSE